VVLCVEEDKPSLDLDCVVPQNATGGRLHDRGSQRGNVSSVVGDHPSVVSYKSLFHRFLGGLSRGDSQREQHSAVGKDTGETAHVERWNNTLRQRIARFVRKTLSFSKSPVMHQACLDLFLHRYNRERVLRLGKMEALR
jgi:hypothetical protein